MADFQQLKQALQQKEIAFVCGEPMKAHTSFHIGGPCALFVRPGNADQMRQAVLACRACDVPFFVLGKGSNLLVSDDGCALAVLSTENLTGIYMLDARTIWCESGVSLAKLCTFAQQQSLSGLEFAYGIPGSVGGAVTMNAGAYGGEMKDVVRSARHIDPDGNEGIFQADALDFSYRHSVYSRGGSCILGAAFELTSADPAAIRAKMDDLLGRRKSKQPLEFPSAGSTFKRPVGGYASALIEQCGLKGMSVGGAQVSPKHSGFIVNAGGASCADVLRLMRLVRDTVREKTGFVLEPEVKMLGKLPPL